MIVWKLWIFWLVASNNQVIARLLASKQHIVGLLQAVDEAVSQPIGCLFASNQVLYWVSAVSHTINLCLQAIYQLVFCESLSTCYLVYCLQAINSLVCWLLASDEVIEWLLASKQQMIACLEAANQSVSQPIASHRHQQLTYCHVGNAYSSFVKGYLKHIVFVRFDFHNASWVCFFAICLFYLRIYQKLHQTVSSISCCFGCVQWQKFNVYEY